MSGAWLGAGNSRGHGGFFYDQLFLPLMRSMTTTNALLPAIRRMRFGPAHSIGRSSDQRGSTTSRLAAVSGLTELFGRAGGTVARADVADFVVQQLTADTWLHNSF
ncbi:hypothetical protein RGCCGE502_31142 (plasmid) [Rhizobium grahamii CCGE 502]|uniref:Uncharacterized protein n=2 Tax=Rhizobium grahamii TaxID=1120045 RepID=S3H5H8_9HYPH|nr:hypothetical protein RGCCGE502_31142 [Rhizobium grahamii CCGE 502]